MNSIIRKKFNVSFHILFRLWVYTLESEKKGNNKAPYCLAYTYIERGGEGERESLQVDTV